MRENVHFLNDFEQTQIAYGLHKNLKNNNHFLYNVRNTFFNLKQMGPDCVILKVNKVVSILFSFSFFFLSQH